MIGEPLTVETLARAIHEDMRAANLKIFGRPAEFFAHGVRQASPPYDDCPDEIKACRREQARLMLERWLR